MKNLVVCFVILLLPVFLLAQDSSNSKLSLTVGTELNMLPVVDPSLSDSSGSSLSIAPYIKIQSPSGIGIKAQGYLLAGGPQPGYYMTSLTPFYSMENKKISFDLSYSHFFISDNKALYYTPITNEIYTALTFKGTNISPTGGVDLGFGTDTTNQANTSAFDINIFLGVMHSFNWDLSDNVSLNFSPKLLLNIGTDRYFEFLRSTGFITHSKNPKKIVKTKLHGINSRRNATTTSLPSIAFNNLELNTDFNFSIGQFTVEPEVSLFAPFGSDQGGVFGYWQLGVSYKFGK